MDSMHRIFCHFGAVLHRMIHRATGIFLTGGNTMATFFNQATLTYNNNVVNSNITTGEIQEALTANKTAVLDVYSQGGNVTYVVNIRNTGTTSRNNLTITDDLGAYIQNGQTRVPLTLVEDSVTLFINGIPQTSPAVIAGPPLTITGISVPADGVATIVYIARINTFAPLGTDDTITNTVTVSGNGITPITAEETITAAEEAQLTITKSLNPTVVTENGQITYTFVIQNTGNTPIVATDDAIITDAFDPILSNLVVTFNGAVWTAPANYTYNPATGLFATNPGQITVPAATYTQDPATGAIIIQPGVSVLTVTGTI